MLTSTGLDTSVSNWNKSVNYVKYIINKVQSKAKTKGLLIDDRTLKRMIDDVIKIDAYKYTKYNFETVSDVVSEELLKKYFTASEVGTEFDLTGLDEDEHADIIIDKIFGMGIEEIKKLKPIKSNLTKHFVMLDSRLGNADSSGSFSFNISNVNFISSGNGSGNGYIATTNQIKNVISVRLYNSYVQLPAVDFYYVYLPKLKILINEFKAQSYIAIDNNFHFIGSITADYYIRTEDYNDGLYEFHTPVQVNDALTLKFYHENQITPEEFALFLEIVCMDEL